MDSNPTDGSANWFVLNAIGEDTGLATCGGTPWGLCARIKIGKPTGFAPKGFQMSWPSYGAMQVITW